MPGQSSDAENVSGPMFNGLNEILKIISLYFERIYLAECIDTARITNSTCSIRNIGLSTKQPFGIGWFIMRFIESCIRNSNVRLFSTVIRAASERGRMQVLSDLNCLRGESVKIFLRRVGD